MEYHQVTINEWLEMKEWLRKELNNIRHSYVVVGYILRTMEETKAYEAEGYKSVAEFALKEHGLKPSTTSRWMSINREFSLGGYDKTLDPKYADMNASQLIEMLGLPVEDRDLVTSGTSREDIREMKRFNRDSEGGTSPASGAEKAFCDMLDKDKEIADRVRKAIMSGHTDAEHMAAAVAPSGSKMYRAGTQFLAFKASGITVKTFGGGQESLDWSEFTAAAVNWFEKQEGGNDIDTNGKGIEGGGIDSDGRDPREPGTDGGTIPQGRDRKGAEGNSRHDTHDTSVNEDYEGGTGAVYSESSGVVCDNRRGDLGSTKEDDFSVSCEDPQGNFDGGEEKREDKKNFLPANDRKPDEATHDISGGPQESEEESGNEGGMNPPEDPVAPAQKSDLSSKTLNEKPSTNIVDETGRPAPEEEEDGRRKIDEKGYSTPFDANEYSAPGEMDVKEFSGLIERAETMCDSIKEEISRWADWDTAMDKCAQLIEMLKRLKAEDDATDGIKQREKEEQERKRRKDADSDV